GAFPASAGYGHPEKPVLQCAPFRAPCPGTWGGSSAGRASRSQCEGREFDPPPLHQILEGLASAGPFCFRERDAGVAFAIVNAGGKAGSSILLRSTKSLRASLRRGLLFFVLRTRRWRRTARPRLTLRVAALLRKIDSRHVAILWGEFDASISCRLPVPVAVRRPRRRPAWPVGRLLRLRPRPAGRGRDGARAAR